MKKTAVITGAGGVLCSCFAKELAGDGFKVALLDINYDAAKAVADGISAEGGTAKAYKANVLEREMLEEVRKEILSDISEGNCDAVFGTQALISKAVNYRKLGLVITDEQHRFGVNRRTALESKGKDGR